VAGFSPPYKWWFFAWRLTRFLIPHWCVCLFYFFPHPLPRCFPEPPLSLFRSPGTTPPFAFFRLCRRVPLSLFLALFSLDSTLLLYSRISSTPPVPVFAWGIAHFPSSPLFCRGLPLKRLVFLPLKVTIKSGGRPAHYSSFFPFCGVLFFCHLGNPICGSDQLVVEILVSPRPGLESRSPSRDLSVLG